jgi:hypothetical protein
MKQQPDAQRRVQPQPPPVRRTFDPVPLSTLAGVVVLLMISYANMRDIDRLDRTLGERLGKLEGQIAQAASRPPAAAPLQRGPDPNRVYTIRTVDAPAKGPAGAPIVVAEFSDFQ